MFSSLTPHSTGPNRTAEVRKAYIVQFAPSGAAVVRTEAERRHDPRARRRRVPPVRGAARGPARHALGAPAGGAVPGRLCRPGPPGPPGPPGAPGGGPVLTTTLDAVIVPSPFFVPATAMKRPTSRDDALDAVDAPLDPVTVVKVVVDDTTTWVVAASRVRTVTSSPLTAVILPATAGRADPAGGRPCAPARVARTRGRGRCRGAGDRRAEAEHGGQRAAGDQRAAGSGPAPSCAGARPGESWAGVRRRLVPSIALHVVPSCSVRGALCPARHRAGSACDPAAWPLGAGSQMASRARAPPRIGLARGPH